MPSQPHQSFDKPRQENENPELVAKLLVNAKFYLEQGSHQQAAEAYQEILRIDAGNKEAIAGLKNATQNDRERIIVNWKLMILLLTGMIIAGGIILWQSSTLTISNSASESSIVREETDGKNRSTLNSAALPPPQTLTEIKNETEQAREDAEISQASVYAPDIFHTARQNEEAARKAMNAGNFPAAESLFATASQGYRRATAVTLNSISDLQEITRMVREKAMNARSAAVSESANLQPSFQQAVAQLMEGERHWENKAYRNAQLEFLKAEDLFQKARVEAAKIKLRTKTLEQSLSEANLAKQNARSSRENLKKNEARSFAGEAYRFASDKENEGQRYLENRQYQEAILAFHEAAEGYQRIIDEYEVIGQAEEFYRKYEYEQSLEKLKEVLLNAPYEGSNNRAQKMLAEIESRKAARDDKISRAKDATEAGDLQSAYTILNKLPERNSPTVRTLIQEVLTMDKEPPEIIHQPEKYYEPKEPLQIRVTVRDKIQAKEVRLFYKRENEPDYETVTKQFDGQDEYRFSIAPDDHKRKEIHYFFSATDISGNTIRYDDRGKPFRIKIRKVRIQVP